MHIYAASAKSGRKPSTPITRSKSVPRPEAKPSAPKPWGEMASNVAQSVTGETLRGNNGLVIQRQMTLGAVSDRYEAEADRLAPQIVSQINAPAADSLVHQTSHASTLQIKALRPNLQLKSNGTEGAVSPQIESGINQARGKGRSLESGLQNQLSQAMGADFSGVRIHADTKANQLSQSLNARAFTSGQDVFFKQGEYQPGSQSGQTLIAHELTHVVQQNSSGQANPIAQRQTDTVIQRDDDDEDVHPGMKVGVARGKKALEQKDQELAEQQQKLQELEYIKYAEELQKVAEYFPDVETQEQRYYILVKAMKYAAEIDQGNLVAFGDNHSSFDIFAFPRLIAHFATKKSQLLLEAPDISLKELEAWGETSADAANIARLGKTVHEEEGFDIKGIDALHSSGSGYVVGDMQYVAPNYLDDAQEVNGTMKYPDQALGPGGRIGPMRQKFIAEKLKAAMDEGGCLLVIGSVHIEGKKGRYQLHHKAKAKKKKGSYTTPSLHELVTGKKGEIDTVNLAGKDWLVQVIKKSHIK